MVDAFAGLAITWVIGIWGVRQQPGLIRNLPDDAPAPTRSALQPAKYERSALTDDHAARIAAKIEQAMSRDMLYRDANLSLWDLAKHIKVTSNYVSQTLNMTLNSNFFDYVNKWRIKDAVKQLRDTDETILVVAYDVGFNSRSSFYNAFKREMGTTPSKLRSSLS
jgi:AraC-like DNA-binding protein